MALICFFPRNEQGNGPNALEKPCLFAHQDLMDTYEMLLETPLASIILYRNIDRSSPAFS